VKWYEQESRQRTVGYRDGTSFPYGASCSVNFFVHGKSVGADGIKVCY
jgi:hypothetical protein